MRALEVYQVNLNAYAHDRPMKHEWRKYLSAQAPRYTSYPSALYFDGAVDADRYAAQLDAIGPDEPLSLYVHVPFCRQLCWYCGCNMRVENDYDRALRYVDGLIKEIRLTGERLAGRGRPVALHFGGGTPNYLRREELARIIDALDEELRFADDAKLAMELDPRLVSGGDIECLATLGFNRMSLGVQDFNEDVQRAINRVQSFEMIDGCVNAMRAAGIDDISFDLIYGLPKQTIESFAASMARAIALSPDRLAVFGYAHLPQALPHQRLIPQETLPEAALRAQLSAIADEMLTDAGYIRIGFDHYAKPGNLLAQALRAGALKRNFQGFTDDTAKTALGFGVSAISFVNGVYAQNEKSVAPYLAAVNEGRLPAARGVARDRRDDAASAAIERLLCRLETDLAGLFNLLNEAEVAQIDDKLAGLARDGVIERDGATVRLREDAWPLSRVVAAAIDPRECDKTVLAQAV